MKFEVILQDLLSGCGCVRVVKVASFFYGIYIKRITYLYCFPGHPGEYKMARKSN